MNDELTLPTVPALTALADAAPPARMEAFSFGEPTPVLDSRDLMDYVECWMNGRWYEPPISFDGLAKTFRASTHHSSAIYFKRNILLSTYVPHPLLSREAFSAFALDYLIFGNAYLEKRKNRLGGTLGLKHALSKYVRRSADLNTYFYVRGWRQEDEFEAGSVYHMKEADINQEVYGLPEYLSTLQAAWLNESATLFRRKYYTNGSHAGYILYLTDATQQQSDVDDLREKLRQSKGPGNFRNLFLYSPNGKKDGVQIIPVSEVAAKDDFMNIKNVSRDDVLAAHRIPPQLLGIVPSNTGGFGAIIPAAQVFAQNEVVPLQNRFKELNEWLGEEVVTFTPYEVGPKAAPGDAGPKGSQ